MNTKKRKLIITDRLDRNLFEGAILSTKNDLQLLFGKSNFGRVLNANGITKIEVEIIPFP